MTYHSIVHFIQRSDLFFIFMVYLHWINDFYGKFHPYEWFLQALSRQFGCFFVVLPIQIGGILFRVPQNRTVTGVTDWGSECTRWWSAIASISLSVILSLRWSLNAGCHSGLPSSHGFGTASGRFILPPVSGSPSALSLHLLSQLYMLPLFSSFISSPPTPLL